MQEVNGEHNKSRERYVKGYRGKGTEVEQMSKGKRRVKQKKTETDKYFFLSIEMNSKDNLQKYKLRIRVFVCKDHTHILPLSLPPVVPQLLKLQLL